MASLPANDREMFWRETVARFEHRLVGWLSRTPIPARDLEDLVAEVWARALDAEEGLRASQEPWAFVRSLIRAVWAEWKPVVDHELLEADAYAEMTSAAFTLASLAREAPVRLENVEDDALAEQNDDQLRRVLSDALAHLSKRERDVMTLRFFGEGEGLEYPDIAKRLRIAESTVRQNVMRARRHLRKLLAGTSVDPVLKSGARQAQE